VIPGIDSLDKEQTMENKPLPITARIPMNPLARVLAVAALAAASLVPAHAQGPVFHGGAGRMPTEHLARATHGPRAMLDARFGHDHYYPMRGEVIERLPERSIPVAFRGDHFFFHGGVWLRPFGGRFVVVEPPLGVVVPALPPAYVTVTANGSPYYYANGVYYAPAQGGYVVVAPPPGALVASPAVVAAPAAPQAPVAP
jgi:hypothetical protein